MRTPDEIKDKIADLQSRHEEVTQKRAALGGQLQAKKEELASIIQEVREAGYDPKNLPGERDKAQQALETLIDDFELKLKAVEDALAAFDSKK